MAPLPLSISGSSLVLALESGHMGAEVPWPALEEGRSGMDVCSEGPSIDLMICHLHLDICIRDLHFHFAWGSQVV
jgi:hypothetical protein